MGGVGHVDTTAAWAVRSQRVLGPDGVAPATISIEGSRIAGVARGTAAGRPGPATVDLGAAVVAPGLVDTQINGAFGVDLVESPEAVWELAAGLARHGVTAFLPTLPSHDPDRRVVETLAAALARPPDDGVVRARPLGLHLEGPFLAPGRRGAHPASCIRPIDTALLEQWLSVAPVAMVTLAPELDGAPAVAAELAARRIVVAAGHTDADADVLDAVASSGAVTHATHCWNAMGGVHHRAPGTVGAILLDRRYTVGLVCDGHHVVPPVLDLTWRVCGSGRIVPVSDAVAAAAPGAVDSAAADATGVLRGGLALLDEGLRVLHRATGADPAAVIATATHNPARLLGRRDLGIVEAGAMADLVVLDDELQPIGSMVGGTWALDPRETGSLRPR